MTFNTVLIANRGEIAIRIARTAKEMGLRTVSVFTDVDRSAPHVLAADTSVHLPEIEGRGEPYLDGERLIETALQAGVQAIHPGYGFLSENAGFAQACVDAGLVFVGPSAEAIRLMGDKADGKRLMIEAGVPCIPGYSGSDQSDERLTAEAEALGTPLLIKAVAGGGGRGIRRVEDLADFADALSSARSEAAKAFGSDVMILERALERVRHIEVQVFADQSGNAVHLFERDCSSQRRNQKVIEEAPSPAVDDELRRRLGEAAVRAAKAISYLGAGTVEFLATPEGEFYFIEMNTRIQVEHPVTEEVTGTDLVAWQFLVAAGENLPLSQEQIQLQGASIEVRLYAEDPAAGFVPLTGLISGWEPPHGSGIRVDHAVLVGSQISARYDPMVAKVIATGATRDLARQRLCAALRDLQISGLVTNRAFLLQLLEHEDFARGEIDTAFVDRVIAQGVPQPSDQQSLIAAALHYRQRCYEWNTQPADWSSLGTPMRHFTLLINDIRQDYRAALTGNHFQIAAGESGASTDAPGTSIRFINNDNGRELIEVDGRTQSVSWSQQEDMHLADFGDLVVRVGEVAIDTDEAAGELSGELSASMEGLIIATLAAVGDSVEAGTPLLVLEAMKMEHRICAPIAGVVTEYAVAVGDQVSRRDRLVEITPHEVA
ncbi:MAG: acetyl/propionyl/methylcrotonyl-CoA carboxylase subunit alpha [Marinobacter sp.]